MLGHVFETRVINRKRSLKKLSRAEYTGYDGRNVQRDALQAAATVSGTLGTSVWDSGTGAVVLGFAGLSVEVEVEGARGELLSVFAFFFFLSSPNASNVSTTNA